MKKKQSTKSPKPPFPVQEAIELLLVIIDIVVKIYGDHAQVPQEPCRDPVVIVEDSTCR